MHTIAHRSLQPARCMCKQSGRDGRVEYADASADLRRAWQNFHNSKCLLVFSLQTATIMNSTLSGSPSIPQACVHAACSSLLFQLRPRLQDGSYIVHYFRPQDDKDEAFHGKIIPLTRFRINHRRELPDPKLLRWHYQQCVMMNIRAFEVRSDAQQHVLDSLVSATA